MKRGNFRELFLELCLLSDSTPALSLDNKDILIFSEHVLSSGNNHHNPSDSETNKFLQFLDSKLNDFTVENLHWKLSLESSSTWLYFFQRSQNMHKYWKHQLLDTIPFSSFVNEKADPKKLLAFITFHTFPNSPTKSNALRLLRILSCYSICLKLNRYPSRICNLYLPRKTY